MVAGLSVSTGGATVFFLERDIYPRLSIDSTHEDPSQHD